MDAKEVKTHVAELEKAVRDKLPSAQLIDILNSLKRQVVATESLLRETKVGMAVNKLRMNSDKAVSELAKEIVGKWKKDVHQKTKPAAPAGRKASTASPTIANTPLSPAKPSGKKPDSKLSVDPSKRSKIADGVDYKCTGDGTRDNCVGMLYDGMCIDAQAASNDILQLAKSLEQEVFLSFKRKIDAGYKRRIQSLFLNLKDKSNPALRKRVVAGEISTARLATMSSSELASEERKAQDEAIKEENTRKAMVSKAPRSISDQLTCVKCGQKKVTYTQAQTRSADEPMTTFCACESCGHLWKFAD